MVNAKILTESLTGIPGHFIVDGRAEKIRVLTHIMQWIREGEPIILYYRQAVDRSIGVVTISGDITISSGTLKQRGAP